MSARSRMSRPACCFAALCLLAGSWLGCRTAQQKAPAKTEPADPQPTLAAAGDPAITLFGEIPGVPQHVFESRAAVSLRQHSFPSEGSDFDPAVSRDGRTIVFASTRHSLNADIYVKSVDGLAVTQLTSDPASDVQPSLSPDRTRVAFASDRTGNWDIWIINIDGQQPVQVTSSEAHEVHPSWSPDGSQLVFCTMPRRGGQWELWLASAEAGAIKKFIGYGLFPEWAPSGQTILYQRARRRGSHWFSLWTLELIEGEPRMPTEILSSPEHAMILPTWSPDEKQIAYCAVESVALAPDGRRNPLQQADIWMADIDGRGKMRLTDGVGSNYAPTWSKLGRIFFTSDRREGNRRPDNESIWSVIPLRAPLAAAEEAPDRWLGGSDTERAGVLLEDASGEPDTAGFSNKQ